MAGIRDDSAGDYGQWLNPQDQSWADYLGMKAADFGGGAYNALANITGSLSPIGTSEQGNMSLQVPPMITGLYDSAKRIGQSPGFTRVPEFDAQLKQDLANGLLSVYGGNALAGLAKPRGALGAGAMREAEAQPIRAYRGFTDGNLTPPARDGEAASKFWASSSPKIASSYATDPKHEYRRWSPTGQVAPVEMDFKNPMTVDANGRSWDQIPWGEDGLTTTFKLGDHAQSLGHDGLVVKNVYDSLHSEAPLSDTYAALQRGTVKSPLTGETLFSDTGKPSILGSALATAGEQSPILNRIPDNLGDFIPPADGFQPRGVARMGALESLLYSKVINAPGTQRMRGGEMVPVPPLNDLSSAAESLSPYDISVLDKAWRNKTRQTGELFSRGVPLPQQDDNLPPWLKF